MFIFNSLQDIKWAHFSNLVKLQQEEGLRAGTKLTTRHTEFSSQKMKVKLAVQLLSSSTAVALNFCERLGISDFVGSRATANFARIIDRFVF